ncbi:hypothetical protein [uncultured Paenibacillus sp.]|uniref:hypothetical protein n=1 Tax=uncultured Paenibacillus sp. TaxID=227322 RepID=UPI0028D14268|nr:hypothetical protein [uncultured Paenibacillus sp.]
MRKYSIILLTALLILAAGCGTPNNKAEEAPTAQPGASSTPAAPTAPVDSEPEKTGEEQAVSVQLVSAQYMVDDLNQPIVFEVILENKTDASLRISHLDCYLITQTGEVLETGLSGYNSEDRVLISGGRTEGFKVAFVVDAPENIRSFVFGKQSEDIFVEVPGQDFPELVVVDKSGQIVTEPDSVESVVPEGGGVKADDYAE